MGKFDQKMREVERSLAKLDRQQGSGRQVPQGPGEENPAGRRKGAA